MSDPKGSEPAPGDELDSQNATSEDDVADLRRQLAEANGRASSAETARQAAERVAGQATNRAISETGNRMSAEEQAADNAIAASTAAIDRAEAALAEAQEKGDFKGAAKANRELTEAVTKKSRWEERKDHLAAQRVKFDEAAKDPPAPVAGQKDALGNDLAIYTPAARDWISRHPDYLTSPDFVNRVVRADALAYGEGHTRDSLKYYERVEEIVGLRQTPDTEESNVTTLPARRQAQTPPKPGTPVSRSSQQRPNNPQGRVAQLSEAEREMARLAFPELKDEAAYTTYADNKDRLTRENRIGPGAQIGR